MTRQRAPAQRPAPASGRRLGVVSTVMACTSGLTVANIYYAQPLLGSIAGAFGLSEGTAALAVTFTQIGYALGMVLLLPLGDRLENRSLIMWTTFGTAAALVIAGLAPTAGIFMAVSVLIGLCSVVAQIVVPFATHLAPPQALGRMLGTIMFGLLSGIMLARSVSSFAAAALGWRAIFLISAGLMVVLAIIVRLVLPRRSIDRRPAYSDLMRSVAHLAVHEHTLQRRSITQAALFGAFTVFWTIVPLQLHDALGFTQTGIGVFALVGASGAVAAPIAGRMADAGLAHRASGWMLILAAAAMLGALLWGSGQLAVLVGCAIALDFSVQAHQVFSQSEIYRIDPGARSRINTVFMTTIFAGGAVASIATGLLHDEMGWGGVFTFGLTLPLAALIVWIVHDRRLSAS